MNLSWLGGCLPFLLLVQDPPPPRPDLVARYAAILEKGPPDRRTLAAQALLSLGRSGFAALRKATDADPDLAKTVAVPPGGPPPALALVRLPPLGDDDVRAREAVKARDESAVRQLGTVAEPHLWEALDASPNRAALAALYAWPRPRGRPSPALKAELERGRDFDVSNRPLSEVLNETTVSWILLSPRDERVTLRLRGVTLADFLAAAAPHLAAVGEGDLLILVPHDRLGFADPAPAVWATADLAPKIETALDALARGDSGPIDALTGVGAYHALRRAARSGGEAFAERARAMRKSLAQRVYFIDPPKDDGEPITLSPAGSNRATVAAFEKAAGFAFEAVDARRLDEAAPAFRFRGIPAGLAARALAFRLNRL
jgi:hypothetical protein